MVSVLSIKKQNKWYKPLGYAPQSRSLFHTCPKDAENLRWVSTWVHEIRTLRILCLIGGEGSGQRQCQCPSPPEGTGGRHDRADQVRDSEKQTNSGMQPAPPAQSTSGTIQCQASTFTQHFSTAALTLSGSHVATHQRHHVHPVPPVRVRWTNNSLDDGNQGTLSSMSARSAITQLSLSETARVVTL